MPMRLIMAHRATLRQLQSSSTTQLTRPARRFFTTNNNRPAKPSKVNPASAESAAAKGTVTTRTSMTTTTTGVTMPSLGIGVLAGALGSLAGMGGGFVMIPCMTTFLHVSQHVAHGTSLAAVAATGMAGAVSYRDQVDVPAAVSIALGGLLTAPLGARATTRLSDVALQRALGMLMLCMGPAVPFKQHILDQSKRNDAVATSSGETTRTMSSSTSPRTLSRTLPPLVIGLGSGFMAGLFGVGGGIVVVPALVLALDCEHHVALATSLAAMVLPAARGTLSHAAAAHLAWPIVPGLATGALVGAYVGGRVGGQTSERTLQYGFSGLLVLLGARTLVKA